MTPSHHSLLADLGWLRALARSLARDAELADDLVQDTCTVALAHGAPPRQPRAWLTTVMRRLLHAHRRREAARLRRDAAAAAILPAPDTCEQLARAEAQHQLAAAVLQLDEPYRSTVLLRYFDGLPPRRIAARLRLPVATVHSRLQRALQQLRLRLDDGHAGREGWLAALAPFAFPTPLLPGLGLLCMNTPLKMLLAAAVLACSVPFWWPTAPAGGGADEDAARSAPAMAAAGGGDAAPARGPTAPAPARGDRLDVTPPASAAPAAPARHHVAGRVCDCAGNGMAGVPIAPGNHPELAAVSDAIGNFALDLEATATSLAACDERFATVLAAAWSVDTSIAPVVVVAPARRIAGVVLDQTGQPVANALASLQLPDDFDARLPMPLDRGERRRWQAVSGADGRFALPTLPAIFGATLLFSADVFAPTTATLPPADTDALQVVLQRFSYAGGELEGRVIDPSGVPVEGARIAMGLTSVASDRDGRFTLSLRRAGWPTAIVAAKAGFRPARCAVPGNGGRQHDDWPRPLVLRLGEAPLSVRGRVVDQDQRGIAGAEVWIDDPTPLGIAGLLPLQLEYLLAGGLVPRQASQMRVPFADRPTEDGSDITQFSMTREASACWYFVTTDANGEFALPGLLDRSYTLKALDPDSGRSTTITDVLGASYRTLCIDRSRCWRELRGKVVSHGGAPMAGVAVAPQVFAFATRARVPGGRIHAGVLREGHAAVTAADGTFVLHDVDRSGHLSLSADTILPTRFELEGVADPAHCTVVVDARCQVEVALLDAAEADAVSATDIDGEGVDLAVLRSNSNQFETSLSLHDGRSGLFVVPERTRRLSLWRGDVVVRTVEIAPDPRQTTRVQ